MKEFVKNSECFFDFISDIQTVKNRRQVLGRLVEDIRDYLNAEHCVLLLFDPKNRSLVSRVAQDADKVRLPVDGHCLVNHCFNTGETLCVNDVNDVKELDAVNPGMHLSAQLDRAYMHSAKSILLTPVIVRGHRAGVLVAINTPGGFIDFSVAGIVEFAPLLGLAVEIVMLDEALREGKGPAGLPFGTVEGEVDNGLAMAS